MSAGRPESRAWTFATMVAVALLAIAFQAARIPVLEHDVVWAEDGHEFLHHAVGDDPAGSILQPYAGYQHLVPRLLALLITAAAPIGMYAAVVFWTCAVIAGLICAATVWLARWAVPWLPARAALGLVPVVVPLMAPEIIGNLADLHTFMLWLGVWIALSKPTSRTEAWLSAVAMLLATMTEVQLVLVLPIVLLRIRRRERLWWPVAGATVIGVGAQLLSWTTSPRTGYDGAVPGIDDVVVGWLASTVMPLFKPEENALRETLATHGIVAALPWFLPLALAAVAVLVLGPGRTRFAGVVVLLISACAWGGSLVASPIPEFQYASFSGEEWLRAMIDVRYGGAAGMFVAAIVPIAASAIEARLRGRWVVPGRVVLAIGLVAFIGGMAWQSPDAGSHRLGVQAWSEQVVDAQASCSLDGEPEIMYLGPFNREMTLECDDLEAVSAQ